MSQFTTVSTMPYLARIVRCRGPMNLEGTVAEWRQVQDRSGPTRHRVFRMSEARGSYAGSTFSVCTTIDTWLGRPRGRLTEDGGNCSVQYCENTSEREMQVLKPVPIGTKGIDRDRSNSRHSITSAIICHPPTKATVMHRAVSSLSKLDITVSAQLQLPLIFSVICHNMQDTHSHLLVPRPPLLHPPHKPKISPSYLLLHPIVRLIKLAFQVFLTLLCYGPIRKLLWDRQTPGFETPDFLAVMC